MDYNDVANQSYRWNNRGTPAPSRCYRMVKERTCIIFARLWSPPTKTPTGEGHPNDR